MSKTGSKLVETYLIGSTLQMTFVVHCNLHEQRERCTAIVSCLCVGQRSAHCQLYPHDPLLRSFIVYAWKFFDYWLDNMVARRNLQASAGIADVARPRKGRLEGYILWKTLGGAEVNQLFPGSGNCKGECTGKWEIFHFLEISSTLHVR